MMDSFPNYTLDVNVSMYNWILYVIPMVHLKIYLHMEWALFSSTFVLLPPTDNTGFADAKTKKF